MDDVIALNVIRINTLVRPRLGLRLGSFHNEDHRHANRIDRHRSGKTTFQLVALGERNKVLFRKKFSSAQLLTYTANLPALLIGLEAGAGAHFLSCTSRTRAPGATDPGQFVKPYRKSNKNDFLDVEAIAEAVTARPLAQEPARRH
jgi:hypothetical protein